MSELKPCPFCGEQVQMGVNRESTVREYYIGCMNCHIRLYKIGYKRFYTEAEAIAAWNSRAERTCKPYGEWERVSQTQEVRHIYCGCGEYLGMDRRNSFPFEIEYKADLPNYCPNCGCKVVGE